MFFRKYGDFVMGVVFLALSAAVFISAGTLPRNLLGSLGSDFLPKLVAVFCAVLSVLQIISGFRTMLAFKSESVNESEDDKPEYNRVIGTLIVFTAYVFLLQDAGFIVSSAVYLFLQMIILSTKEKRNFILFAVISIVFSVVVYFIFRSGLNVMLPTGILG